MYSRLEEKATYSITSSHGDYTKAPESNKEIESAISKTKSKDRQERQIVERPSPATA